MTKKILILDTGKEWGGGTNSLLELLKRVDKNTYNFSAIFYYNYKMGVNSDIKSELDKLGVEFILLDRKKVSFRKKILKEAGRACLTLTPGLKKSFVDSVDYRNRILPDSERIAGVLKDREVDLLYMNNQPSSNVEGIIAAASLGIPSIQHGRIDVSLTAFEAEQVNSCAERVICVSEGVKKSFIRAGVDARKCIVIHNGIDSESRAMRDPIDIKREFGLSENGVMIGTVGSLVKRKRIHLLLEAVAFLKNSMVDDISCVIVGDGPERDSLEAHAQRLGVRENCFFTGFSDDPLSYINTMDVFVLSSAKEGLPRVIMEAMLLAKPVIAFDITGPSELVDSNKTGILLREGGSAAIAEAVKKLITDDKTRTSMGDGGRRRVLEEFSMEQYISGVVSVFEEVLA